MRAEVREWVKEHTTQGTASTKKDLRNAAAENHDAFEWLIVHVVVPNTVAATQPRVTKGADGSSDTVPTKSTASRWGKSSTTLLEKFRADFNPSTKATGDHVAQIRIDVNDVPYDLLPRVVPAVPTGYMETAQDAKVAWAELIDKIKRLILSSFDMRVTQYEDDIREKDAQRSLPGWNFCTFFILKEGLARGFESVGLVEDALVGYDELSVGLDTIIQEQAASGLSELPGGSLLSHTEELKRAAQKALTAASTGTMEFEDEEHVDLQSKDGHAPTDHFDEIPISVVKKPYRELILANNVSIFDFRCYLFARQIALLLRLGNAWSTREELVAKLKEQQESILYGLAPRAPAPKQTDESENLSMLAEICKRTLEFIPAVSQVMRRDVIAALGLQTKSETAPTETQAASAHDTLVVDIAENIVASFAFSVAQQILAQTSTKSLPIPHTTVSPATGDGGEQKASIPEPKTMMHPARTTSLRISTGGTRISSLPSPNPFFPGPGARADDAQEAASQQYQKAGVEELASRRAELYALSRNILEEAGKKRGWSDGWPAAPVIGETGLQDMQDVSLDDEPPSDETAPAKDEASDPDAQYTVAGLENNLLRTALDNSEDFYRLYELLTDKALRHYTVANHTHSVLANMSDLAVLKYYLKDYATAASYFVRTTPFYGESGWSLLELSMLVMYSTCLRELKKYDEYVRVVLKLLTKAASSEKDRIQAKGLLQLHGDTKTDFPQTDAFQGFLPAFLEAAEGFNKEVKHAVQNFFINIELDGPPRYDEGQDSFRLTLKLRSVLADPLPIEKAMIRLVTASGAREMWVESEDTLTLEPGRNKIELCCKSMSPGTYEVDRVQLHSSHLKLNLERQAFQPVDRNAVNLRNPYVVLYQRTDTLDVQVEPAAVVQLDQSNAMDVAILTGWNQVESCEIRIRAATGGLRLLTSDAQALGAGEQPARNHPEPGLFLFSDVAAHSCVKFRIPFTTEHDAATVSVKVEAKYTTSHGTFTLSKTPSIPLALKLGVNVQDVFKHSALFSRFTVSTSTPSPLRLFRSELSESDVFESRYGVPPSNPTVIFPKQPASLLYQIQRKRGVKMGPHVDKTMYLKLTYSVLHDEIMDNIRDVLTKAMKDTPLWQYCRLVTARVLEETRTILTAYDLERAAVLGDLPTGYLTGLPWSKHFCGLGVDSNGEDVADVLAQFVVSWTKKNPRMAAMRPLAEPSEQQVILIPVDIPSMSVVHTADIRLQKPVPSLLPTSKDGTDEPVACVNQLLPATLHLKWTRIWDTDGRPQAAADAEVGDEFSYEVIAPGDTWLVGGRKKGHFVIPSARPGGAEGEADAEPLSSSPINEADIPLVLIPLREGWLPYPAVEVREVSRNDHGGGSSGGGEEGNKSPLAGHCETDYRNLGETVRVVADRGRVTVSLDASGPGGGPLVLESERRVVDAVVGRVVA